MHIIFALSGMIAAALIGASIGLTVLYAVKPQIFKQGDASCQTAQCSRSSQCSPTHTRI